MGLFSKDDFSGWNDIWISGIWQKGASLYSQCHEYRDHRAQVIEDAVWGVGQSAHAEHIGLRHSACRPRNDRRSDGGTVFYGAAQELWLIAIFFEVIRL